MLVVKLVVFYAFTAVIVVGLVQISRALTFAFESGHKLVLAYPVQIMVGGFFVVGCLFVHGHILDDVRHQIQAKWLKLLISVAPTLWISCVGALFLSKQGKLGKDSAE